MEFVHPVNKFLSFTKWLYITWIKAISVIGKPQDIITYLNVWTQLYTFTLAHNYSHNMTLLQHI